MKKIFGLFMVFVLAVTMFSSFDVLMASKAFAGINDDGSFTFSIGMGESGPQSKGAVGGDVPPSWKPYPPSDCGQPIYGDRPLIKEAYTDKKGVYHPAEYGDAPIVGYKPACNDSRYAQPGDTSTSWDYGFASWPASTILHSKENVQGDPGPGGVGVSRPPASGLWGGDPVVDNIGMLGLCQYGIRYISLDVYSGFYSPTGIGWKRYREWRLDANRNPQITFERVTLNSECSWPSVRFYVNDCPLWVGDVYATGPTGTGLPVTIDENNGLDPLSVKKTYGALEGESGTTVERSAMGEVWSGWGGLSDGSKVSYISSCPTSLMDNYNFTPIHPGNWMMKGQGERVKCHYMTFAGLSKYTGCDSKRSEFYSSTFHKKCTGNTDMGWLSTYDFSCAKTPQVCIVGVDKNCPGASVDGYVTCAYEPPTLKTPEGNVIDLLDKPITLSATGKSWVLNWGDLSLVGVPGAANQWTDYYVKTGSSPGKSSLKANSSSQPFNGEYGGSKVLIWSDEKGKGISGPPWAETLTMNWYTAGRNNSSYEVYQERRFTWINTYNTQNVNGTYSKKSVIVPQTCKSKVAKFNVVQGRSVTGN